MSEPVHVSPQLLRDIANRHEEVVEQIAAARAARADILAAVATYGPIMHRVKAAVADVLAQRDMALGQHDATHRNAAAALRAATGNFVSQDELNAERLRLEQ